MSYEYKVIPAPVRGLKAKGLKTAEDRFANALQSAMNDLAALGWEYVRADTLPCEQREGLMGKTTVYQNMLVFRKERTVETIAPMAPKPVRAPKPPQPLDDEPPISTPEPVVEEAAEVEASQEQKQD